MRDVRSLPPAEVAIASVLAAGLWALQTRSWRRTELHVKNRDNRPGSNRQTEHRVLAGPLGRSIAQASDADAARQSPFDGSLHEVGREEGQVRELLDFLTWISSFEGFTLRPTIASYS